MKKYTDIPQFRDVVREVKLHHDYNGKDDNGNATYLHKTPYPTLKFKGTTKKHGTNSAIVKYADGRYEFQSRERILSTDEDNQGFMTEMLKKDYQKLFDGIVFNDYCAIYGEWCGEGIMKGVALNKLPKMFVIFSIKIDDVYVDLENYAHLQNNEQNIYNDTQFPSFEIEIDFNQPELSQNKLVELTTEVEKECPIGKYFGVSGVGEGIVWQYINGKERYIFKVKGEKHQSSKVRTLAPVNTEEIENMNAFIEYAVTESRLTQGIEKMRELGIPFDVKSTADYLRWVYNDIIKEESDTIEKNNINVKKLGGAVSAKARLFWLNYLNTHM